ncbi:hypothetical protein DFH09DRAFT_1086377 [Mycena vulgaris]|nr:hypothetical protein DFH09DRAFT_1086377 [Mycena vulgaris]
MRPRFRCFAGLPWYFPFYLRQWCVIPRAGLAVNTHFIAFETLSFLVDVTSIITTITQPLPANLAPPERRTSPISVVISGLILGVLFALKSLRKWSVSILWFTPIVCSSGARVARMGRPICGALGLASFSPAGSRAACRRYTWVGWEGGRAAWRRRGHADLEPPVEVMGGGRTNRMDTELTNIDVQTTEVCTEQVIDQIAPI